MQLFWIHPWSMHHTYIYLYIHIGRTKWVLWTGSGYSSIVVLHHGLSPRLSGVIWWPPGIQWAITRIPWDSLGVRVSAFCRPQGISRRYNSHILNSYIGLIYSSNEISSHPIQNYPTYEKPSGGIGKSMKSVFSITTVTVPISISIAPVDRRESPAWSFAISRTPRRRRIFVHFTVGCQTVTKMPHQPTCHA